MQMIVLSFQNVQDECNRMVTGTTRRCHAMVAHLVFVEVFLVHKICQVDCTNIYSTTVVLGRYCLIKNFEQATSTTCL